MRTLQRMPAHFRATLALAQTPQDVLTCVTRDLHVQGALLHLHAEVPEAVRVGSRGSLVIELAAGVPVELNIVVRHRHAHGIGVCFVTQDTVYERTDRRKLDASASGASPA